MKTMKAKIISTYSVRLKSHDGQLRLAVLCGSLFK